MHEQIHKHKQVLSRHIHDQRNTSQNPSAGWRLGLKLGREHISGASLLRLVTRTEINPLGVHAICRHTLDAHDRHRAEHLLWLHVWGKYAHTNGGACVKGVFAVLRRHVHTTTVCFHKAHAVNERRTCPPGKVGNGLQKYFSSWPRSSRGICMSSTRLFLWTMQYRCIGIGPRYQFSNSGQRYYLTNQVETPLGRFLPCSSRC